MKKKVLKKITPYTYKRVFDLTMFPQELLKKYYDSYESRFNY